MSTFQPSVYSGGAIALNNGNVTSCQEHKTRADKYRDMMWKSTIFSAERQAYEHKANAEDANYLACKEGVVASSEGKVVKSASKIQGKGMTKKAPSASNTSTASAEADAAIAAAALEAESSSVMPMLLAFGGIALVGGIAFLVYRRKKASGNKIKLGKKKKKIGGGHAPALQVSKAQAVHPIDVEFHAPEHA
jgi:LPXTG-motif cell wall-anchored protein